MNQMTEVQIPNSLTPIVRSKKRKYQEIWEMVKSRGFCLVEVKPFLVPRVKKAVLKEKDEDLGFKFESGEDLTKFRLKVTIGAGAKNIIGGQVIVVTNIIKFELKKQGEIDI